MNEKEKEVVRQVRRLLKHKNDFDEAYGTKIYRPYSMSKEDYEPIEKLLLMVEDTCLKCGKGKPGYCEDCHQKLIGENAKLQARVKELEIIEAEHKRLNGELRILLGIKERS